MIDKITIKKGEEKVKVIAVANSRLTTEINIKMFIARKHQPLNMLKTINFLFMFLKTVKYSFVKKSNKNNGIIAEIFLNKASCIIEYSSPKNFITTIYKSTQRTANNIVITARYVFLISTFSEEIFIYNFFLKLYKCYIKNAKL